MEAQLPFPIRPPEMQWGAWMDDSGSYQGSRKRFKKGGDNIKQGGGGRSQSASYEKCSIEGHEKYRHGWRG